jgi:hypothetical protein
MGLELPVLTAKGQTYRKLATSFDIKTGNSEGSKKTIRILEKNKGGIYRKKLRQSTQPGWIFTRRNPE